jgi:hypothetical protein
MFAQPHFDPSLYPHHFKASLRPPKFDRLFVINHSPIAYANMSRASACLLVLGSQDSLWPLKCM